MSWQGRRPGPLIRALAATAVSAALAGCANGLLTQKPPGPLSPAPPAAVSLSPETMALAETALAEERYDDATRLLRRIRQLDPENMTARLAWAELTLATGSPDDAVEQFDALTLEDSLAARAYQGKGIALTLIGDREAGYASVQRALAEDEDLPRAWRAVGYYHDAEGNWTDAVAAYDRALALDPAAAETHNNRGFSMMMQRRYGEAVADLNEALRLDPNLGPAQENLRLALAWQGNYTHAMSGVGNDHFARTLSNIGFVALLRGDYAAAESLLLRAMEADPTFNQVAWKNLTYLRSMREINAAEATKVN